MLILGIDPGYAIVGWGVLEYQNNRFRTVDYGAITTPAGMDFPRRLEIIYREMEGILARYKVEAMSLEKLYFQNNKTTAIDVAQARGVILLAAQTAGVPVHEYTPMQVKMAVTGHGKAEKQQVQIMVKALLGMREIAKPDDAADAIAVAITHANSMRMKHMYKIN